MTLNELSTALQEMYETAPQGEKAAMIHLFGIRYAAEIKDSDFSINDIVKKAGLSSTYVTEINKGIRLAPYVIERNQ